MGGWSLFTHSLPQANTSVSLTPGCRAWSKQSGKRGRYGRSGRPVTTYPNKFLSNAGTSLISPNDESDHPIAVTEVSLVDGRTALGTDKLPPLVL